MEKPENPVGADRASVARKNNSTILYAIIAILAIAVIGLIVYIVVDKNNSSVADQSANVATGTCKESTEKPEEEEEGDLSLKIDKTKDWVYTANYEKKVNKESYVDGQGNVIFSAEDIVAPYINVKSPYADKSNTEIKKTFNEIVKYYNEDGPRKTTACKYDNYQNKKTVSVFYSYVLSKMWRNYYTYNINIEDGSEITYKQAYTQAGFTDDTIEDAVEKAIKDRMLNEVLKDFSDENMGDKSRSSYVNDSIAAYKKKVERGNLKFFLSEDNTLNVIVNEYFPAQMSGREGVFEIK